MYLRDVWRNFQPGILIVRLRCFNVDESRLVIRLLGGGLSREIGRRYDRFLKG